MVPSSSRSDKPVDTFSSHPFRRLLRQHRKAARLTQAELAERASLSVRGINDLERGERTAPRRETVELLADALGLEGEQRAAFEISARRAPDTLKSPVRLKASSLRPSPEEARAQPEPATPGRMAARPPLPTGTVTFLFTDIQESTQLLQRLGVGYADVLTTHQRLLRAAFGVHGGVEVDSQGESCLVSFPTAPGAVAAAVEATHALAIHPWPDGVALRVRMGLHTGAPAPMGERYIGIDVHRAARIAAAGHGGQILLSEATAGLVRHELLDEGMALRDLGVHRFKDLQQAEHVYQVVADDLPSDFAPLRALDSHPHNLPIQPTPIMGREREVEEVSRILRRSDVRLVTLSGPPGIGKTRLGLQVAAEVADALDVFPDGVWFVRLSRITNPELVASTIADVLGIPVGREVSTAHAFRNALRDKRLLLLLDNFEQVVAAAPQLAETLIDCSGVKVLVTSRVALHLRGEHEYSVQPLALPDTQRAQPLATVSQYAAVALFIERAQAAQANFAITNATAFVVAEICARLDGLPLAIELAAARVKLLPLPALLKRLERQLAVLTGGARDLDERQQTMRATLKWSYDLLSADEQRLFSRLATFVGGCTLDAAEAICAQPEGAEPLRLDMLDGLSRLVDQHLVQQREEEDGEPRFGMLHIVREYALEQLEANGEAVALRRAHAQYYLALARRLTQEAHPVARSGWKAAEVEREHDNLRAALAWVCDAGDVEVGFQLVGALERFWSARGYIYEGRAWAERLLALDEQTGGVTPDAVEPEMALATEPRGPIPRADEKISVRLPVVLAAADWAMFQNDLERASELYTRGLAWARALDDARTGVEALGGLAWMAMNQGDTVRGMALEEESLAQDRTLGDERWLSAHLATTSWLLLTLVGDEDRAAAFATEALQIARRADVPYALTYAGAVLAMIAARRHSLEQARTLATEALTQARSGEVHTIPVCLGALAMVAGEAGDGTRAATLLGAAIAMSGRIGVLWNDEELALIESCIEQARAALGEASWADAVAAGQRLSAEEAIAVGLGGTHVGAAADVG